MLFRTRDLLVRQRTQTINALRGHLAEFGIIAPQGRAHVGRLAAALDDPASMLPGPVRAVGRSSARADCRPRCEDRRAGEAAPGPCAPGRRDGAPDDDPGDRADLRDGAPGLRAANGELPAGPRLLRLARPGATPAHDRGQAEAWQDIEDGSARPQTAAGLRRHGGGALGGPCAARRRTPGSPGCCRASRASWSRWRWPTGWRASPGR